MLLAFLFVTALFVSTAVCDEAAALSAQDPRTSEDAVALIAKESENEEKEGETTTTTEPMTTTTNPYNTSGLNRQNGIRRRRRGDAQPTEGTPLEKAPTKKPTKLEKAKQFAGKIGQKAGKLAKKAGKKTKEGAKNLKNKFPKKKRDESQSKLTE